MIQWRSICLWYKTFVSPVKNGNAKRPAERTFHPLPYVCVLEPCMHESPGYGYQNLDHLCVHIFSVHTKQIFLFECDQDCDRKGERGFLVDSGALSHRQEHNVRDESTYRAPGPKVMDQVKAIRAGEGPPV